MRGDPSLMRAWIREHYGDEIQDEWAEIKRRLRREKTARGPIDDTGPFIRLTAAWIRGDRRLAFEIARAIDLELGWYGFRLAHEPVRWEQ